MSAAAPAARSFAAVAAPVTTRPHEARPASPSPLGSPPAATRAPPAHKRHVPTPLDPHHFGPHRSLSSDAAALDAATQLLSLSPRSPHGRSPLADRVTYNQHPAGDASGGLARAILPERPRNARTASTSSIGSDDAKRSSLYKTELCRSFEETGACRYGGKCQFAHGQGELRIVPRHPRYKTEICKTFHTIGTCPYGKRCRFIHLDGLAQYWSPSSPLSYLIPQDEGSSGSERHEVNAYFSNLRDDEPCPLSPVDISSEIRASSGASTPRQPASGDSPHSTASGDGSDTTSPVEDNQTAAGERPRSCSTGLAAVVAAAADSPLAHTSRPGTPGTSSPLSGRRLPIFQLIESSPSAERASGGRHGLHHPPRFQRTLSSTNLPQGVNNALPPPAATAMHGPGPSRLSRATFSTPSSPAPGSPMLFATRVDA